MDDVVRAFLENEQKFRLVKRLGRGGFGEVWEAESASGVRSAIKASLDPIDGESPAVKKELDSLNFVKEFSGHPHIVSLLDYWLVSGYLVTRWELATEGDLLQVLAEYQRQGQQGIPLNKLIKWMYESADGLDFLHEKGIYHRDIKPQNLLLFHGHVKIGDLGLAKLVGASTASHTGSGTFGYLPPEAWEEHRLTPSVDLYSLAATYIKLRTGKEPFGTNPVEIVERQKRGEPILDGLTHAEKSLLLQALHFDPEKRVVQGAQAWLRQLYGAMKQRPTSAEGVASARQESSQGKEIRVSLSGDGDVRSLEEAVARCPEGGTIRLGEGTFKLQRPLEITTSLSLLGAGMDRTRVVCDREGFVVKFSGEGRFFAKGMTFQHVGETKANVVEVISGQATFESCRFQGGVRKHTTGGIGLWFHGVALGTVRKCEAVGNTQYGVAVTHIAKVDLESNLCQDNRECGIMYTDTASGTVRNNSCRKNGSYGIGVGGEARPILEGNTCEENSESGIAYKASAAANARNNMCRKNTYHGISLHGQATPTLEGNTCEENQYCGIAYFDNAGGSARKNVCRNNGYHGIWAHLQAAPALEGNTCERNQHCGIAYFGNAHGTARRNVCRSNGYHGIALQGHAVPTLEDNTCAGNQQCGIAYFEDAAGTARNNVCRNNEYHGIALHGKAAPTVEGNTCERNKGCGITYFDSAGGKALKNLCHSNGEYQIRVTEGAKPSLVDNEVYSGISAFMATLGLKRTSGEHEARTLVNSTTEPGCATIIAVGLAFAMFTVCRVILQRLLQ